MPQERLPGVAERRRDGRHARPDGREAVHAARLRHLPRGAATTQRGPVLNGLFGSQVKLANGETVVANNDYIRESILNPQAKIVAGFPPIMPTFQGQVSEEQLLALTEYIKSLPAGKSAPGAGGQHSSSRRRRPARSRPLRRSPGSRDT